MPNNHISFPVYTEDEEGNTVEIRVTIERTDTDTATVTLAGAEPSPIELSNVRRSEDGATLTGTGVADFTALADRYPLVRTILEGLRIADFSRVQFDVTLTVDCDSDQPTLTIDISMYGFTVRTLAYSIDPNRCREFLRWVRGSPIPQRGGWWKRRKSKVLRKPSSKRSVKSRVSGTRRPTQA